MRGYVVAEGILTPFTWNEIRDLGEYQLHVSHGSLEYYSIQGDGEVVQFYWCKGYEPEIHSLMIGTRRRFVQRSFLSICQEITMPTSTLSIFSRIGSNAFSKMSNQGRRPQYLSRP
eukprot:GILJ01025156.1.p1 GENE.GILJ01025156.1~~GILJ01025156.1.p1  ORF type:complete len:128 (+),score=1.08 GILJ01025156.1:38-385(+)